MTAGLRVSAVLLLLVVSSPACAPPDYVPVGLQVDLVVDPEADPFEVMRGVRICVQSDLGDAFYLYPDDPGTFLVPDLPTDMSVSLEIQGIDLEPLEVDVDVETAVLALATVADASLSAGEEAGHVSTSFELCSDDCPTSCALPPTLPAGEDSIGLRRMESTD